MNQSVRLSVVVPAYNEAKTLSEIISRLLTVPRLFEIVIVDDHSTDATGQMAERLAAA